MTRAALALLALAACDGETTLAVTLDFDAFVGDVPAACGTAVTIGTEATAAELADARLFLSNVELRNADGAWIPVALDDTLWQTDGIALLDFEDGTALCADSGTAETNTQLTGTVADGTYSAVRFDVGLPFEDNHLDSATAPPPLNAPGMFWVWQTGYKFLRVDFAVTSPTPARWNTHIGSTQCLSDAPSVGPENPCARPGLATITLESGPDAPIRLDLEQLVQTVDVAVNTAETPPGCMSSPMEPSDCSAAFDALGLSFDSAACADGCADQTLFVVDAD
jgi:uncharacterized repeat protein (TIGR04052 family)